MKLDDILFEIREKLINGNFMNENEIVNDCKWKSLSFIIKDSLNTSLTKRRIINE